MEFIDDVKRVLPYDREQYLSFFYEDADSLVKWYGISFQLITADQERNLEEVVNGYEDLFRSVVLKFNASSCWFVNHDDMDLDWFPGGGDSLAPLRTLFSERRIPDTFKGGLVFTTEELLRFDEELIKYPAAVLQKDGLLYKDLSISHDTLQLVIKISGHLNVDFLSTDLTILNGIIKECSSDLFLVKAYRGTPLF